MPHVRVTRPGHPTTLPVALRDRHVRPELLARLIQEPRQVPRITHRQLALAGHPDRFRGAGHQVRVLVLLTLTLTDQVAEHPDRLRAARYVRDHGSPPVAIRERPRIVRPHACRPLSTVTAWMSPAL